MKKKSKRFSLNGDTKPMVDLAPEQLEEAVGGAGALFDPSGTPKTTQASPSGPAPGSR